MGSISVAMGEAVVMGMGDWVSMAAEGIVIETGNRDK